jgi:hypothetical protein
MRHQLIARVIECPVPDEAETLAWRTPDDHSDIGSSDTRM